MDNAEKELKKLKDGIEIALNNLQTRYDEVLKNQNEIIQKLDSGELFKDLNKLSGTEINAYQNGGELQALSFAIREIKCFYNSTNESN
ncbi:hypothetical protein P9D57_17690 [Bacillus sonorensis]|uniref:hypothetical protein n=1 Tax=Bacillus sonorensis TaxID=119858 RepID=UPI002DB6C878|nr:hypothetical protein [Bacillus sonorensis]MEC1440524.1 hypothetical protein [Bacillus sonorensis]